MAFQKLLTWPNEKYLREKNFFLWTNSNYHGDSFQHLGEKPHKLTNHK